MGKKTTLQEIGQMLTHVVEHMATKDDGRIDGLATKEQLFALQTQVNGIETQLRDMQHVKLHARVADFQEESLRPLPRLAPPAPNPPLNLRQLLGLLDCFLKCVCHMIVSIPYFLPKVSFCKGALKPLYRLSSCRCMTTKTRAKSNMSRVVFVSNRVLDLSKAARAGGVAVVLANIVRTRKALWFGWNGEITPAGEVDLVERQGPIATAPLSDIDYARYYLGYANSVLWPVFHNRLDLAQFEAGFFEQYIDEKQRLAALLHPLLRGDDIIWIHDYHLIPFAGELRRRGVGNPIGFYLHIPFPPWQTFMAVPEHRELARMLTAYDLIGVQTQADVANLLDYMSNGVDGRIVPDGRIRVFERLVSIASFPVGIDMTDFAKAKRSAVWRRHVLR